MSQKRLWIATAIIAVFIIVGFVFSVPHTSEVAHAPVVAKTASAPSVTLHDAFKKGTHTISGSLLAPDACTAVTARAVAVGDASSTENIRVIISMTGNTGTCLKLPTSENFSTTIVAPAHLPISATVDGKEASTTVL